LLSACLISALLSPVASLAVSTLPMFFTILLSFLQASSFGKCNCINSLHDPSLDDR
jgi:hypothetical protein